MLGKFISWSKYTERFNLIPIRLYTGGLNSNVEIWKKIIYLDLIDVLFL